MVCYVLGIQIQGDQLKNVLTLIQYIEIHFLAIQFDKGNSLPFNIHVVYYINCNYMTLNLWLAPS